jgi:translocation and assembly module TamB
VALLYLAVAPFTETGTGQLLRMVDRLTPLELDHTGGSLGGELHLGHLVLATESIQLRLEEVRAQLNTACLWRSALCFRRLSADTLSLELLPSPDPDEAEDPVDPGPKELLQIPLTVETDSLSLGSVNIGWPDGHWRQGAMQAGIRVGGESIEVLHATIQGAELYQAQSDTQNTADPVSLPGIDLPLDLSVDDLRLQSLSYQLSGAQGQLDFLPLQGHWRNSDLQLAEFGVAVKALGTLEASGAVQFEGDWPLALTARVILPDDTPGTDLSGREISAELTGDLKKLQVAASAGGTLESSLRGSLSTLSPGLPFDLSFDAHWDDGLPLAQHVQLPEVLAEIELLSPVSLRASGGLEQQNFELRGRVSGLGYDDVVIELSGLRDGPGVLVDKLVFQEAGGDNALRARGEIQLKADPSWSLAIESQGIDLPRLGEYARGRLQGGWRWRGP